MELFAADPPNSTAPNAFSVILLAISGLIVTVTPVIITALNSRREHQRKQREAELAAEVSKATEANRIKKDETDYIIAKMKEIVARGEEQLLRIETESRELQKKHHDCELRLARAEEKIAVLERKAAKYEEETARSG